MKLIIAFLPQTFPPSLILDQFVLSLVEDGIRSCETTNEHGVVFCDIKVSDEHWNFFPI